MNEQVVSSDGTPIAWEKRGSGRPIVLVNPALADRAGSAKLARLLADRFVAVNYDRRGRGASGDTKPYAVQREVEDIEALIDANGGSAYLFGQSSGAVLALEAAARLGDKVTGLVLFEPPFIVDDGREPIDQKLAEQAAELVAAGKSSAAVTLFFTKVMGISRFAVGIMRLVMPNWKNMVAAAGTIPYDFTVVRGTQDGVPLPVDRWRILRARTLVLVGSKSEPYFHTGAQALAELLPNVRYHSLQGADHGSATMAPRSIVSAIDEFLA